MEAHDQAVNLRQAALIQASLSAAVLGMVAASIFIGGLMVDHDEWLLRARLGQAKMWDGLHRQVPENGFYETSDQRLLYGALPSADYSRAGVYLIGNSAMQYAIDPLDKIAAENAGIHNYCMLGQNFTQESIFLHYLIEDAGLLGSGNKPTSILIGLDINDASHIPTLDSRAYWWTCFDGNLYVFDGDRRLHRRQMSWLTLDSYLLLYKSSRFWKVIFDHLPHIATVSTEKPIDNRTDLTKMWFERNGKEWESGMSLELSTFGHLIDYLQSRNVAVRAVYLPEMTAYKSFAPAQRYHQEIMELLAAKNVPVADLVHFLPDEDFADEFHAGRPGKKILGPAILKIAHEMLVDK